MSAVEGGAYVPITIAIDDEALGKHSFDLVHFPMYLDRSVALRVRVCPSMPRCLH